MSCGKQRYCVKDGNFEISSLNPEHFNHFCKYCIKIGNSGSSTCVECQKEGNCNFKEDLEIIKIYKGKNYENRR